MHPSNYVSAIVKCNIANSYGDNHYSTKAYPSPILTDAEWELIFEVMQKQELPSGSGNANDKLYVFAEGQDKADIPYIYENRVTVVKHYYNRDLELYDLVTEKMITGAIPSSVILGLNSLVNSLEKMGTMETSLEEIDFVDRMEKCIVKDKKGFIIDPKEQRENLDRYYLNDKTSTYTIYYDAKTMQPLFNIKDGYFDPDQTPFKLRQGTIYYKWTRVVNNPIFKNTTLGQNLVIDSDTFPEHYRIIGETYTKDQKTHKEQRCQFTIHRAAISTDTEIELEADGDPTVFSMDIDVLSTEDEKMIELKFFDVEEDLFESGTRVKPQKIGYSYTPVDITYVQEVEQPNTEIY